jgi:hypothetical protein
LPDWRPEFTDRNLGQTLNFIRREMRLNSATGVKQVILILSMIGVHE